MWREAQATILYEDDRDIRRFRYSKIVLFVAESDHLSDEYRKAVEREACYTAQCDLRLGRDGFGLKRRPWRGLPGLRRLLRLCQGRIKHRARGSVF